jgi:acetyl esterase/lipase
MATYHHHITAADAAAMAAARAYLQTLPELVIGPGSRPLFDEMISQTPLASGVDFEADTVGGVPGHWCRPVGAPKGAAILYLHGGGYSMGSATAYRRPVSHIAAGAAVSTFALDYRLAPEQPFPVAVEDARAAYDGLVDHGFVNIALAGDSAGGGLALVLAALTHSHGKVRPKAVVAISPWTDLTVSGDSVASRAKVDPLLNRSKLVDCAKNYLVDADPADPRASPLFGNLSGLPAIQIHVGEDEVLLDDAVRYASRVEDNGAKVELHVWEGMLHVFTSSVATLQAAEQATLMMGAFLSGHLNEIKR